MDECPLLLQQQPLQQLVSEQPGGARSKQAKKTKVGHSSLPLPSSIPP